MMCVNWTPGVKLEDVERDTILQAYRFYREDKTTTANALGISVKTLYNKIEQYSEEQKQSEEDQRNILKRDTEIQEKLRGRNNPQAAKYRTEDELREYHEKNPPQIELGIHPTARPKNEAKYDFGEHNDEISKYRFKSSSPAVYGKSAQKISGAQSNEIKSGFRGESASEISEKQSLPLPIGQEVQNMLPAENTAGSDEGASKRVSGSDVETRSSISDTGKPGKHSKSRRS